MQKSDLKMKNIKILLFIIIIIIILSTSIIYATSEENKNISDVKNFIYLTYNNYMNNEFESVYIKIHPDIKEILEKEQYMSFQNNNTQKYDIKISNVNVLDVKEIKDWPEEFKNIIKNINNYKLFEITIKYDTNFKTGDNEQQKEIEKKSYVTINIENNSLNLLWDPEIINKD